MSGARLCAEAVTAVCGTLRAQPCGRALTRTDRAAGAGKRLGCCREQAPRARSDGALWALGPHDWIVRGVVRAGHAQEGRKAEEGVLTIFKLAILEFFYVRKIRGFQLCDCASL